MPTLTERQVRNQLNNTRQSVNKISASDIVFTKGKIKLNNAAKIACGFKLEVPETTFTFTVKRTDTLTAVDSRYKGGLGKIVLGDYGLPLPDGATLDFSGQSNAAGEFFPSGNYGTASLVGTFGYRGVTETYASSAAASGITEPEMMEEFTDFREGINATLDNDIATAQSLIVTLAVLASGFAYLAALAVLAAFLFPLLAKQFGLLAGFFAAVGSALAILAAGVNGAVQALQSRRTKINKDLDNFENLEIPRLPPTS